MPKIHHTGARRHYAQEGRAPTQEELDAVTRALNNASLPDAALGAELPDAALQTIAKLMRGDACALARTALEMSVNSPEVAMAILGAATDVVLELIGDKDRREEARSRFVECLTCDETRDD